MHREAGCFDNHCVLLPASGPCQQDADCEVRPNPYACDEIAVPRKLPRAKAQVQCGTRRSTADMQARCDLDNTRCVIAPGE